MDSVVLKPEVFRPAPAEHREETTGKRRTLNLKRAFLNCYGRVRGLDCFEGGGTTNAVSLSVFNREWTQINANKTFEIKMLW
ncbi:MAG: hypothetical protein RLZZ522_1771 [Verrucomicrobiota bacterium]